MASLVGVVLIARPAFLFGDHIAAIPPATVGGGGITSEGIGPSERGTPAQRLGAVGYG